MLLGCCAVRRSCQAASPRAGAVAEGVDGAGCLVKPRLQLLGLQLHRQQPDGAHTASSHCIVYSSQLLGHFHSELEEGLSEMSH